MAHEEITARVAEDWQQRAEIAGELGHGSRLANKLVNPANFCDIALFADDPDTRELLANHEDMGAECAKFYSSFLRFASKIIKARAESGVSPEEVLNFTLGIRLQYSGLTMQEIADDFRAILDQALRGTGGTSG